METIRSEVIVIGAGGAGMSAAAAASAGGAEVTIVDENAEFGGQIWRKDIAAETTPEALRLIEGLEAKNVRFIAGTTVCEGTNDGILYASKESEKVELWYQKLIIATGARERFIPFPGWTLPNVFGVGGLQALVKTGFDVAGKRIIIAGTGPLMVAVADYLRSKGADVMFVFEQARLRPLARFAARLPLFPSKFIQALSYRLKLGAAKIKTDSYVTEAFGNGKLEGVRVRTGDDVSEYECDILATGFHLEPNLELPLLLGCIRTDNGIEVDDFQKTNLTGIYAAGETTGIGGIELSCVEGKIAGYAARGDRRAAETLFMKRKKLAGFAELLNNTFKLRDELHDVLNEETIVCRCEDIAYGALAEFNTYRDAKLQTRCGMGPCQGRICGGALKYLFDWQNDDVRPPISPIPLGTLGDYEL